MTYGDNTLGLPDHQYKPLEFSTGESKLLSGGKVGMTMFKSPDTFTSEYDNSTNNYSLISVLDSALLENAPQVSSAAAVYENAANYLINNKC